MEKKEVTIIEQAEALKDIAWYLKGRCEDECFTLFGREHIKAITDAINYIQEKELRK